MPAPQQNSRETSDFPETRWSIIAATRDSTSPAAQRALESLCQLYWYPLYAFARRKGLSPEDAEDLTQDFFQRLISQETFLKAAPEHGRLRSFLLAVLKHHMVSAWRKSLAAKRGGGVNIVSIDQEAAEGRYSAEPADDASPDVIFDRSWAGAVLRAARQRLQERYEADGRGRLFAAIQHTLAGKEEHGSYATVASSLNVPVETLRAAVFQLRKRFRKCIEDEVTSTVSTPADAASELQHLRDLLAGRV